MEISSRKNNAVRLFRELSGDKKQRDISGQFAAEGDHLCGELIRANYEISLALYTKRAADKYTDTVAALCGRAAENAVITEEIAEYISDTRQPQGIFAVAAKRGCGDLINDNIRRLVVLDGVQDPGNVGTIIRTAEALGIDGVILSQQCADIWSPKTLRSSMGSAFRVPCIIGGIEDNIKALTARGFKVYGAMLDERAARLGGIEFPEKSAVVIGSEGSGISESVMRLCTDYLYIPIIGAESLNAAAAAAIILWELSR